MLAELLTNYGPIARLWWDDYGLGRAPPGGPPAPGDRGGFPEAFTDFTKLVRSLQSQTVILPGPDGCLVGRELGFGTYPVFNFNQGGERITCLEMAGPPVATNGSNTRFAPHESDHTILNPGDMWWWMGGQAWLSAAELFDHYLATIGRGNTYILNMPPNTTGIIPEYLTNQTDSLGAAVNRSFSPASALARITNDPDPDILTVQCSPTAPPIELPPPAGGFAFDAVVLEEDMRRKPAHRRYGRSEYYNLF
jgi:alpha-L-fucosidase